MDTAVSHNWTNYFFKNHRKGKTTQMHKDEISYERFIDRLEKYLKLKRRGFKITHKELQPNYVVIYDSSQCRIRCYYSFDKRDGEFVGISYGRRHAPNNDLYFDWHGEKQIAWHQFVIGYVGPFLDGVRPLELAKIETQQRYSYKSKAENHFESSGESQKLHGAEWILGFEGIILGLQ